MENKDYDVVKSVESISQEQFEIAFQIEAIRDICYQAAHKAGWHTDNEGNLKEGNKGERIALMHSELSEALEAIRKGSYDDHLPHHKGEGVELADCVIRIFDHCGRYDIPIGLLIMEKLNYNAKRADHKRENREKPGGKAF